jgi:hypothetical protein
MKDRWNDDRETRSTERNPRPSANFSTTNLTWTDLGPNQGFRGKKLATKRVSNNLHNTSRHSSYRAVNTLRLGYENLSRNAVQGNNRCLSRQPIYCVVKRWVP